MAELVIRFNDDAFGDFYWSLTHSAADTSDAQWRPGNESELSRLLGEHRVPVILVIPQQCVYITRFELPDKASRQVLTSIEYQIEDQIGDDVDLQHFALGDSGSNPVAIAVVKKSIMERLLLLRKKYKINVSQIIPELFLCPWSGNHGDVALVQSHESVLLRYGQFDGLKCRVELLDSVLDMINKEQEIQIVHYFVADADTYSGLVIEKYAAQQHTQSAALESLTRSPLIEMQQREFKESSIWAGIVAQWKWVIALLAVLLSIGAYNRALALQDMEIELRNIKQSQFDLLKAYIPTDLDIDSNFKSELITLLKRNKSPENETSFISTLHLFSQAKTGFPTISIDKINYQKKRLSIDVSNNRLNELEALQVNLEKAMPGSRLENLNIKPDIISGRFIMEGNESD